MSAEVPATWPLALMPAPALYPPPRVAQVGHYAARVDERVTAVIPRKISHSGDLAAVVDASAVAIRAAEGAQVGHYAGGVKKGVRDAIPREISVSRDLAAGVNAIGSAVRAAEGAQVSDCVLGGGLGLGRRGPAPAKAIVASAAASLPRDRDGVEFMSFPSKVAY